MTVLKIIELIMLSPVMIVLTIACGITGFVKGITVFWKSYIKQIKERK